MQIVLRDAAVMLLVVSLKAILCSVIGVGLVHAISLVAAEFLLESTPISGDQRQHGQQFYFYR
jgi:hypothetical protein